MEKESYTFETPSSQNLEGKKPLSRKLKYLTAAAIFYGNVVFGCAYNTYDPTVTSFQTKYDTDDAGISRVFTVLTACYMVGALSGGIIFNYVNRQFAATTLLGIMAAMMFLTPHCPTMTLYFASAGVVGLCCGAYDTAQFAWMMEMMQADCPPYVQSQHFFYALGTNLGSVVMAPFLEEDDSGKSDPSKLFIPYTIVGVFMMTSIAYHLFLFIFFRYSAPPPEEVGSRDSTSIDTKESSEVAPPPEDAPPPLGRWSLAKLRFVLLSCCFYGAYQGMEWCLFQFFPKFGQNSDLHLSEAESAYTLTEMTAAYAAGRAVAIVAVFKISTRLILWANIVMILVGNTLLLAWGNSSLPILWTSSILFGLGFSSVYASISAYLERYLNFTNFITALMIVCGSGVASIYPLVIGNYIEENPIVLTYTSYFSILFMIVPLGALSYLTHNSKVRYM